MNAPLRHPVAVLKERPFDGRLRVLEVDWAKAPSIAEILAAQDVPTGFRERCICVINDEIVPQSMWRYVRPKPCCMRTVTDVVVIFRLPLGGPRGGSGGSSGGAKKNPYATVASIAVLLVGTAISGGALGALSPLLAAGTFGAHIVGAGIGLGASLAIAALTPPPSLRTNQSTIPHDNGTNAAASLSGNVLSKGGAVPRVLGTMRVFPPIISPELVEIIGNTTVAECVFGLAGPHQITDLQVGNTTAATSIPDLQTEIQEGLPNSPVLSLISRQSYTDPTVVGLLTDYMLDGTNIQLLDQTNPSNSLPQWYGMTSRVAPDEIWLHLGFPGGLCLTDGTNRWAPLPIRMRMRQLGTSTWINLPEFHISRNTPSPFQVAVKLMFVPTLPINIMNSDTDGPTRAFYSVPTQTIAPAGAGGWTANSYFYNGTGDTFLEWTNCTSSTGLLNLSLFSDRIEFYLNGATFPKSGQWEIQVMRGQIYVDINFVLATYEFEVGSTYNVYDFFGFQTSGGVAETVLTQTGISDACELSQFSSIWNEPPVPDPTKFAVIGTKVTNRSINQLSALASGYVKDWDGSGWNTITTTSNPAAHYYDVLTGMLGGSPLPAAAVDSAGIVTFRSQCIAMGYTCNAVAEGKTYMDVLTMLASSGYAKPAHSELWGVCMDQNTTGDAPVQVFTPRNLQGFSVNKAFARLPTGIRAEYSDSTNNYLTNEIIVFADPTNPDSSRLEQIAYDGLVSLGGANGVDTRATFDLLQGQLRLTFYKGKADMEAIVCQKGDLVGVQYDIFDQYGGAARVTSVQTSNGLRSGGNITGLSLDGSVPVNTGSDIAAWPDLATAPDLAAFGAQTGLCIRLKGGTGLSTNQISAAANGDETAVTFTTPFADPGTSEIDVGCLCSAGYLGTEYRRFKVFGITPAADGTADISMVDEAPGLWNQATGAPL